MPDKTPLALEQGKRQNLAANAPSSFENPPNEAHTSERKQANCPKADANRHIRCSKERPAKPRYEIDDRVKQGDGLPKFWKHRDRVKGSAQKYQRCHHQHWHEIELLKVPRPNSDDKTQERER